MEWYTDMESPSLSLRLRRKLRNRWERSIQRELRCAIMAIGVGNQIQTMLIVARGVIGPNICLNVNIKYLLTCIFFLHTYLSFTR